MINRPDLYNLKIRKIQQKKLKTEVTLLNMPLLKNSNIDTANKLRWPEIRGIICRPDLLNSQIRKKS